MEEWKVNEDATMLSLLQEHGTKWGLVRKKMPHRTVSSIRNRWIRISKSVPGKQRCRVCGQPRRGHVCWKQMPEEEEREETLDAPPPPPSTPERPSTEAASTSTSRWSFGFDAYPPTPRREQSDAVDVARGFGFTIFDR